MNKQYIKYALIFLLVGVLAAPGVAVAHERNDGKYFTILDEQNQVVWITGWRVNVGDQFLTEQNKKYEVISVEGDTARAKFLEEVKLSSSPGLAPSWANLFGLAAWRGVVQHTPKGKIAIYHSHTDESYVPTDGTESEEGKGGVIKVGEVMAKALQDKGIQVIHDKTVHDPHDDMAYERSRRTASKIIGSDRPDAIFDVHRDAVPPQVYQTTVNGQEATKVNLVVGRQNPNMKATEDFATQLKAASDKKYPGLVKGIFYSRGGDFNEDLLPRSILIEVGSHTNSREAAERGVTFFSDVIATMLYGGGAPPAVGRQAPPRSGGAGEGGSFKAIGWILALLVIGGGAYLALSTGGLKEAKYKLGRLTGSEFANFLGRLKWRKRNLNEPPDEEDR